MSTILPLSKVVNSSRFTLAADSFDITNYLPGGVGNQGNDTLGPDTPKGVLGGAVAVTNLGNDWSSAIGCSVTIDTPITGRGNKVTATLPALGLFAGSSEGNAFENAPAAASGIVPIYMCGGLFEVYVFETHTVANVSQYASYTIGAALYCSVWGFLTPQLPTDQDGLSGLSSGADIILAHVTKVPTATDLVLGIKLLV